MNLEFSEEQQLLTNMVERFGTDRYDVGKRAQYVATDVGFSRENWTIMADAGLLMIPFSEGNGGLDGTAEDLICVMRPLGKAVAVEPYLSTTILAGSFLEKAGSPDQHATWIPKIISGEAQIALAHIEAAARYDLDHVATTYSSNGAGSYLNGSKTFVLGAGAADAFIVSATSKMAKSGDRNAIRFFLLDANAEGCHIRRYVLIDGSIGCELVLNNALAEPLDGTMDDLHDSVNLTKIGACAEMLGLMERLFEATVLHVKTREQFGRPLSKFQVIQHRLAESYATLELAESHVLRLAAATPKNANYGRSVAGSKAYISKVAVALAEEAVQLHGGMGVTDELIIGHAMKRILLLARLFGDESAELRKFST